MWNFLLYGEVTVCLLLTVLSKGNGRQLCRPIMMALLPTLDDDNLYPTDTAKRLSLTIQAIEPLGQEYNLQSLGLNDRRAFPNITGCYSLGYLKVPLTAQQSQLPFLTDERIQRLLASVDFIVGEYRQSVEHYTKSHQIPFLLTSPPSPSLERRLSAHAPDERVVFSAWPSWHNFFEQSIPTLIYSREEREVKPATLGEVLIILEDTAVDSAEVAHELLSHLIRCDCVSNVNLKILYPGTTHSTDVISLLKTLLYEPVDNVIYFYDTRGRMEFLFKFFQMDMETKPKNRAVGSSAVEWYFWSMTTQFTGTWRYLMSDVGQKMAKFYHLRAIGLGEGTLYYSSCDSMFSTVSLIGVNDAALIAMANIVLNMPGENYNRTNLLNALRRKNYNLAMESNNFDSKLNSGWTFQDGFRVYMGQVVGLFKSDRCDPDWEYRSKMIYDKTSKNEQLLMMEYKDFTYVGIGGDLRSMGLTRFHIAVVMEDPFVFERGPQYHGNDRYQGIAIDIVNKVFERLSKKEGVVFYYDFERTHDNAYGYYNKTTQTWDGAMAELHGQPITQMAIGMISKTKDRVRDFAFTPPFEYVGLSYVAKTSIVKKPFWGFMMPFDRPLWLAILVVFITSAIFIRLLEYWNPFSDTISKDNKFNFKESFWYSFGTVTQGAGAFAPIMFPTRVYSVFYWFFALVVGASYTGNLASFLSESYRQGFLIDLRDLPYIPGWRWATLKSSYMETYIRTMSDKEGYLRLSKGLNFVDGYKAGVEKVKDNDKYAFIGNSLLLQHYITKDEDCSLYLGSTLEAFTELAFPMRKDWELKTKFSSEMLAMRFDGTIREILQRWLPIAGACQSDESNHLELDFDSFHGLYVLLAVFILVSYICLFFKMAHLKLRKIAKKERDKKEAVREEEMAQPMVEMNSDRKENINGQSEEGV